MLSLMLRLMLSLKLRPNPNSILEDMELDMEDMVMATMVLDMEEFIMESVKLKLRLRPVKILAVSLCGGNGLRGRVSRRPW